LIAWVNGSERYATIVAIDAIGLPESTCTFPYGIDCKHGVAVVLEYLERLEKAKSMAIADENDERLQLLDLEDLDDDWDPDISFLNPLMKAKPLWKLPPVFPSSWMH
jgi:uncharacterized Zn finger protein